jgi:hypothetical protein
MKTNHPLISLLSKSESVDFIRFLKSRNKRSDVKNISLYKALLNNNEKAFKAKMKSNAYNVLKKRLNDNLLDFIASTTLESEATTEIGIIKRLLVSRKLFAFDKFKLAFKVLSKAEKSAINIRHYSLLNEIYHTLIHYSYSEHAPNQEIIFERFEENQRNFVTQEKLNMVYALVRKAFMEREFDSGEVGLEEFLKINYQKFGVTDEFGYSFQSLLQIAEIGDIAGAYKRDYHAVDLFFVDKIIELQNGPKDTEKDLIHHIDLLYLISNIYFRKKEFQESMGFLDEMYNQMLRFDKKYYNEKIIGYTTLLALNLNFIGKHETASQMIDKLIEQRKYKTDEILNLLLLRIMIYFQQGEHKMVAGLLAKFQQTDKWYEKKIGLEWVMNKKFIEILLHIELGNIDFVDSRIQSFIRIHGTHCKQVANFQILPFLKLVKKFYHNPTIVTTDSFNQTVQKTLHWKPTNQEDIFLMSFYAWLKSKMIQKPLYETTLELVSRK